MDDIFTTLLQSGGPAVIAAVLWHVWREEKKEKLSCHEMLAKHTAAIQGFEHEIKELREMLRRTPED